MNFNEYQKEARKTLIVDFKDDFQAFAYFALGLNGEAGEVADKVKKILRDKGGELSDEDKQEIAKELGDVLWYLSQFALYIDYDLSEVARMNIEKLQSRMMRGKIKGEGDNR